MLPWSARTPPDSDEWAYEVKYDGFRALVLVGPDRVLVQSRNLPDMTAYYPELQALQSALPGPTILDGELVAYDEQGRQDFERMRLRAGFLSPRWAPRGRRVPVSYQIFDLLYCQNDWVVSCSYRERRQLLEQLDLNGSHWLTPANDLSTDPTLLLAATRREGLEGLVAKRLDSPYRLGERHPDWLKLKNWCRQEFVVGGWRRNSDGSFRSLLVGYYDADDLVYAGQVELGFQPSSCQILLEILPELPLDECPFSTPRSSALWVEPRLVVEVQFLGWSSNDRLKHACFKGFCLDKSPASVEREG